MPIDQVDRLATVGCLGDDLDALHVAQQGDDPGADQGMVVGEQDADRAHDPASIGSRPVDVEVAAPIGAKRARRTVPRPGPDSICRTPSSRTTRSSMLSRPRLVPARASRRASSTSKPTPSSLMTSDNSPSRSLSSTRTRFALACLATFVNASWTTRKHVVSTSAGARMTRRLDDQEPVETRPPRLAVDVPPQRGDQAEVVEEAGPQLERQVAHPLERLFDDVQGVIDEGFRRHVDPPLPEHLQVHHRGRQGLAGPVVQLAGDHPTLVLLGADQPSREGEQTLAARVHLLVEPGVPDGDRQLIGHLMSDRDRLRGEGRGTVRSQVQAADELSLGDQRYGQPGAHSFRFKDLEHRRQALHEERSSSRRTRPR